MWVLELLHSHLRELGDIWPTGEFIPGHFLLPLGNDSGPARLRERSQVLIQAVRSQPGPDEA